VVVSASVVIGATVGAIPGNTKNIYIINIVLYNRIVNCR
jgi:hypothetical protein